MPIFNKNSSLGNVWGVDRWERGSREAGVSPFESSSSSSSEAPYSTVSSSSSDHSSSSSSSTVSFSSSSSSSFSSLSSSSSSSSSGDWWTPVGKPTMGWWDAGDTTTLTLRSDRYVTEWRDKAGNASFTMYPTGGTATQPDFTLNTLNNHPILTFDGVDDAMHTAAQTVPSYPDAVALVVFKPMHIADQFSTVFTRVKNNSSGWQIDAGEDTEFKGRLRSEYGDYMFHTPPVTDWCIIGLEYTTNDEMVLLENGANATNRYPLGAWEEADIRYGIARNRANNNRLSCQVAEIVIMPKVYRTRLEGYLAWKWGIEHVLPVNHPYKTKPPEGRLFSSSSSSSEAPYSTMSSSSSDNSSSSSSSEAPYSTVSSSSSSEAPYSTVSSSSSSSNSSSSISSSSGDLWTPVGRPTRAWWDISDETTLTLRDGRYVTEWRSKDGNGAITMHPFGNEDTQPDLGVETRSGHRVAYFDGVDDAMKTAAIDVPNYSDTVVLVVFKPLTVTNEYAAIYNMNADGKDFQIDAGQNSEFRGRFKSGFGTWNFGTVPITDWVMLGYEYENNNYIKLLKDGAVVAGPFTNFTEWDRTDIVYDLGVNRNEVRHLECLVAETVAMPKIYRDELEGYLAWKWGIEGSLPSNHPYKTRPPEGRLFSTSSSSSSSNSSSSEAPYSTVSSSSSSSNSSSSEAPYSTVSSSSSSSPSSSSSSEGLEDWEPVAHLSVNNRQLASTDKFDGLVGDTYDYKMIVVMQSTGSDQSLLTRFNGDAGSDYQQIMAYTSGTATGGASGMETEVALAKVSSNADFRGLSELRVIGSSGHKRTATTRLCGYISGANGLELGDYFWTNTADELTSIDLVADAANGNYTLDAYLYQRPKDGSFNREYEVVSEVNMTSRIDVDFTGLHGDTDKEYILELHDITKPVNNPCAVSVRFNGDTGSDYRREYLFNNAGALDQNTALDTSLQLTSVPDGGQQTAFIRIMAESGTKRTAFAGSAATNNYQLNQIGWWTNEVDELNYIRLFFSEAVTGRAILYKRIADTTWPMSRIDVDGDFSGGHEWTGLSADTDVIYEVFVHLQDKGSNADAIRIIFNGDTGVNYNYTVVNILDDTQDANTGATSRVYVGTPASGIPLYCRLLIYPAVGKYRPVILERGFNNGSGYLCSYGSYWWKNTSAALDRIRVYSAGSTPVKGHVEIRKLGLSTAPK